MADSYPDWWPYLEIRAPTIRLQREAGYACRICDRQFSVRPDSKGRLNRGFLLSGARRHAALCDELRQIAERMDVSTDEARKLRARWSRIQNQERNRQ